MRREIHERRDCCDCGEVFDAWFDYQHRCLDCYRTHKSGQHTPPSPASALSGIAGEIRVQLRDLLFLCHPDRNEGSARATEVTRWLLSVRDRM